jgi:iron complex outermembrane receptor protein
MRRMRVVLLVMSVIAGLARQAAGQTTEELKRLSLEDLLNVDVTTVSRSPEPTMRVPAAVYVITGDDLRRSGAQTLADALRLAPGVQVARISAGTWAIGVRGFADRLARSMLVLIDGRAVYSALFAGTYWETQDTFLEDVERIEVIRGPGGTLWGANAVNGIINIITKTARATHGIAGTAGAGSQDARAGARFGGAVGAAWHYRVYGKGLDRQPHFRPDGLDFDGFRLGQGGFRADWTPDDGRSFTVQGDVYRASLGQRPPIASFTPPFVQIQERDAPLSGANVTTRWASPAGGGRVQVQAFYARTSRDELPVKEDRDTADVDFQHAIAPWREHHVTWGAGYRVSADRITAVAPSAFFPDRRTDQLFSAFVQDEIDVSPNRVRVTLGTKLEHNEYSGVELQPGIRLLYTPDANRTIWAAVTRAVRTPSRVETDYTTASLVDPAVPMFVRLSPNPDFRPERLVAYETGYRVRFASSVYVSTAVFFNRLNDVLSTEVFAATPEPAGAPTRVVIPVTFANGLDGESYGAEISADVRATPWWRWMANYSYVRIQLSKKPDSRDGPQERRNEGQSPRHQVQLQSSIDLPGAWSLDAFVRHISKLPAAAVDAYTTADLRLGWQVTPNIELAVVGQDLGQRHHVEWPSGSGANVGIRRSGYISLTFRR